MNKTLLAISSIAPLITLPIGSANAAPTSENETLKVLERIIVTGEKKRQSLRQTASSISVLTNSDLDQFGLFDSSTVLDKIPNIVTVEPGNDAPAIRGVDGTGPASGANAFFAGTRPRLNYQIDGRTLGFNEALFQSASLWDVSQVEVYRGPQSTLQGRNSIAGAIVIHTEIPSFDWQGKARLMFGQHDYKVGSLALSGPLIDNVLAFRLAGDYQRRDSIVDFTPYPEESNPSEYKNETVNEKFLFTPNDDIESLLTIGFSDGKAPQSERVVRPFQQQQAQFATQPTFRSKNNIVIWDTSWLVSDLVTLELDISRTDFTTTRRALQGLGNLTIDGKETVFQPFVRLQSDDEQWSGFIAAYIFDSEQDEYIDLFGGGTFDDETENRALYGELNWQINEQVNLSLGGRYEREERYRKGGAGPLRIDFSDTYHEFLPKATIAWHVDDNWTVGVTAGKGYNGGGAGITFSPPFVTYTYQPEFVTNLEGFARADLLANRLSLTANVFYNRYKDMQLPFSLGADATVIRNAERASSYGLETSATYYLSKQSQIFANFGLIETEVDRYSDPTVEGKDLARAPAFSADIGMIIEPIDKLSVSANIRYTDAYYSDATNTPRGKVGPYTVANMQVSYQFNHSRVFVKADNIFDADDEVSIITPSAARADSAKSAQS
ncbi:TonB-dependent receptor [Thalassotalea euphylliae]|uniref:TonB-dependent receptor n=1 Tax=Thalassotalea euphylliae TaxID=1655234 RepID=UPI0015F247CA|nr:TonB-dependent receptor [Thalassotalea euphylliae]